MLGLTERGEVLRLSSEKGERADAESNSVFISLFPLRFYMCLEIIIYIY